MKYLFEWTPEMSVYDVIIDEQHKRLLGEVNTLLSYVVAEKNDEMISQAISFLDRYITEHLYYEEQYMEDHKFPLLKEHLKLHKDFIDHYNFFKKQFDAGVSRETLAFEIEQYIGNWWIEHIGKEDHKYAEYIRIHEKNKK